MFVALQSFPDKMVPMTGTLEENRAAFVLARVFAYNFNLSLAIVEVILDISTLSVPDKIMNLKRKL